MYKTTAGTGLASTGALAYTGFSAVAWLVVAGAMLVLGTLLARVRTVGPMPRRQGRHKRPTKQNPTS